MALTSFLPSATPKSHHHDHHKRKKRPSQPPPPRPPPPPPQPTKRPAPPSSWEQFKSLLSCRIAAPSQVHEPSKLGGRSSSCGSSICAFRDVVHGNTRVVHRSDTDHYSSASDSGPLDTAPLARRRHPPPPPPVVSSGSHSKGGMQLRKLSGCYECHAISAEPASRRYPRSRMLCACPACGEVFTKSESLELHQTIRHAVSELGAEDSGRNIVEIIFKSSWQKKDHPICKVERILKVHNTQRTIARFEDYRNAVKARALLHLHTAGGLRQPPTNKKNPRCAADGNELLRFHCTTLACSLGARGSTALCSSAAAVVGSTAPCGVCAIIRHGFGRAHHPHGVCTTASSGRAHDCGPPSSGVAGGGGGWGLRAMLVCRVIAGRVRRPGDADPAAEDAYDSVAGAGAGAGGPGLGEGGAYTNLEELFVANPRAILPCFVVIYRSLE